MREITFAHEGISPQRISESSRTGPLGCLANDSDRLGGGRDVVPGSPVWFVGNGSIEIVFDNLLSPTQFVAPAHWKIMACIERYGATPEAFFRLTGASATKRATQSYGSLGRASRASGIWVLWCKMTVGCTSKWIWETMSIARHSGAVKCRQESGSFDLGGR
jgi:hypothetical protein